ncbi:MAG: beta-aspartyl-peptidase [Nannocystaceae bacterium]|nr:beta-aspartyl-peptidase [Nannocystaceae bacterium]
MFLCLRDAELWGPEARGRVDVLVAAERVVAIGEGLSLPAALGPCETLELGGRRLVPGLIDAHVHVTGGGGEGGPHTRVPPLGAGELAHAGVTTCVGVLGTDGTTRSVAELVAQTLGLRAQGLSAWCYTGSYELPLRTLTGSVRSDLVFVDPVLGVGELALSDHRSSQPSFDELLRVASDAHVAGMMSGKAGIVHLHMGDGPRGLELVRRAIEQTELPASVFHPTHVNRNPALLREAQALAREHGCVIDITAFPDEDLGDAIPAHEAIVQCLDAGVAIERITCSSDGGGCMPRFDRDGRLAGMGVGRPATLLAALVRTVALGLPLDAALRPFTSNVARTLRLPDRGHVTVGGFADLLALDDDGAAHCVVARGQPWLRDRVPVRTGTFERS